MQIEVVIPSYEQCEARVKSGGATALEDFIWANEPAGKEREEEFRAALALVLAECRAYAGARHAMNDTPIDLAAPRRFVSPLPPPEGFAREVLTVLIEECAEVIQRATKALRFGLEEVQPGQPWTNNCRLSQEIGDLYATINLATKHKLVSPGCIADGMDRKAKQLAIYLQNEEPST